MNVIAEVDVAPSGDGLLDRITEIGPVLRANTAAAETARRLPDESLAALTAAGAFRVAVPRRHGGYGMSVRETMEVLEAVGQFCGASAWIVMIINTSNWMASHVPPVGQDEMFASGANIMVAGSMVPTGEARRVEGGYVVSGRWPWASGSWHANWMQLGMMVDSGDGTDPIPAVGYAPAHEVSIEETWFVAGLKGTGSNTLVADEIFIPKHRTYPIRRVLDQEYVAEYPDESASRAAFAPLLTLGLGGFQLGLGRAALELVIDKAPSRALTGTTYTRQMDSTGFQIQVARAAQLIETARLHVFRAADAIDALAAKGVRMPYVERARVRSDNAYSIGAIVKAVDLLLSAHGASSFADVNPLQRIWRDCGTGARHAAADPMVNDEIYGKALLGIPYEENIALVI
jgi:alkylation response protein AidB-like acyl-CoA dehydrogenase